METAGSTSPRELLIAARDLIADERRWTQRAAARLGHEGARPAAECDPLDDGAAAWCGGGAVVKVIGHPHGELVACPDPYKCGGAEAGAALHAAAGRLYPDERGIAGVNDGDGHAAVLACFDAAIAELGG